MTAIICDIAQDPTAHLDALFNAGYRTIFGYASSINPTGAKCWTVARVQAAKAKGFRIGIVHEGWGGAPGHGGISASDGARDGIYCAKLAPQLGAPSGACIYFACDTDFNANEIKSLVVPYFAAIRFQLINAGYRVGVYGSGAVCAAVIAAGVADLSWEAQSTGWSGFGAFKPKATMVQGAESRVPLDLDPDTAQSDIGDFVPFAVQPTAPVVVAAAAPAPSKLSTFLKSIGIGA